MCLSWHFLVGIKIKLFYMIMDLPNFTVVKSLYISYNINNLRCSQLLLFLNLQYFKRDSYIVRQLPSLHSQEDCRGRQKSDCGCPPGIMLGVKRQERHFGAFTKEKSSPVRWTALLKISSCNTVDWSKVEKK